MARDAGRRLWAERERESSSREPGGLSSVWWSSVEAPRVVCAVRSSALASAMNDYVRPRPRERNRGAENRDGGGETRGGGTCAASSRAHVTPPSAETREVGI